MSLVISLNGTSLLTNNIRIGGTIPSWQNAPASTRAMLNVPSRIRNIASTTDQVAPRQFVLPIFLNVYTLADRVASLDYLKGLHRTQVTVRMADGVTTRELVGYITNIDPTPRALANNPACDGTLTILAADPTWRDTSDTVVSSIGGTPVTLVLGTAPVEDWALDVTGFTSNLTVTFTGPTGYVCTYTASLAGGHTLHVNADVCSVLDNSTNSVSHWAGGMPAIDPSGGGTPVTIALTAAAGTPSGTLTYRKRWY